jgi:hypothetical protein
MSLQSRVILSFTVYFVFEIPFCTAQTWEQMADMPTARELAGCAVYDGKIYIIGGIAAGNSYITTVERYDPSTNSWATMAPLPDPRFGPACTAANGLIYAMGGVAKIPIQILSQHLLFIIPCLIVGQMVLRFPLHTIMPLLKRSATKYISVVDACNQVVFFPLILPLHNGWNLLRRLARMNIDHQLKLMGKYM